MLCGQILVRLMIGTTQDQGQVDKKSRLILALFDHRSSDNTMTKSRQKKQVNILLVFFIPNSSKNTGSL